MKNLILKFGKSASLLAFSILILATSCTTTSIAEEEEIYVASELTSIEQEAMDVLNDYRTTLGLNPLEFSQEVYVTAAEHTNYMISKGELSHDNFQSRASELAQKTQAITVAENVARNYLTPEDALKGWLSSAKHKSTLEGDFTHTAIAVKQDINGNNYYTNMFLKK